MKLSAALRLRKDYVGNLDKLRSRITSNCVVQEGSAPAEDPNVLIEKYLRLSEILKSLISDINYTNSQIRFKFNGSKVPRTMTEALAERDELERNRNALQLMANKGVISQSIYTRKEIKSVSCVDVHAIQKRVNKVAAQGRRLEDAIEEQNWICDLIATVNYDDDDDN
ncbi:hypothetical protein DASC09_056210 [Saccharomycopsis crataegensis]|uniref:Septicolysin n=1 Tax=Saccharomycopsis crataegensis TaxID=43959 RepID=A0AAV5QUQ1_9ASCO|nr:hypothetical protein DASC09_056210 [Saccharomycopsis crataegensis]